MDAIDKILKELHLPNSPDYSSLDYWNKRYARNDDRFEWLQQYQTLRPFLLKILHGKLELVKVIYLGCGTSTLANSLINEGLKNIECIDFSDVLIRRLKNSPICYQYMDVTEKWDYKTDSIDLLIDKGLMDTIMCGEGFYERLNQYFSINNLDAFNEQYTILRPDKSDLEKALEAQGAYLNLSKNAEEKINKQLISFIDEDLIKLFKINMGSQVTKGVSQRGVPSMMVLEQMPSQINESDSDSDSPSLQSHQV